MAFLAGPAAPPDRRRSPVGLSLNLPSNNPFRNRAASPSPQMPNYIAPTGTPPGGQRPPRPTSTNPFLDDSELSRPNYQARANAAALSEDIFNELSLLDRPATNSENTMNGASIISRPMNLAPPRLGGPPPPYRPVGDSSNGPHRPPKPTASPDKNRFRAPRPRRASDSSVMEKERRPRMDREEGRERTESEERRRRERRREREERHKKERERERVRNGDKGEEAKKKVRKPQGLDLIDKLDVTGIYGQGLFHHDGPFDACNPHRNAKKDRRAPMQAFPADSANMQLGGAGPLRSRLDLDKFHGREIEGFTDYATARKTVPKVVDPLQRVEPVHGKESQGLGTSTFLEGAPASKKDIQRRDSEDPAQMEGGEGGLSRKKSIVQRFRGMSGSRRNGPGDFQTADARYRVPAGIHGPTSPREPLGKPISAGGTSLAKYNRDNEINPFDNDYEAAFERKGTQIRIAEQEKPSNSRPRTDSSPRAPALHRSQTSDSRIPSQNRPSSNEEERSSGSGGGNGGVSGFLNRMKSVKGGPRRPRNDA